MVVNSFAGDNRHMANNACWSRGARIDMYMEFPVIALGKCVQCVHIGHVITNLI